MCTISGSANRASKSEFGEMNNSKVGGFAEKENWAEKEEKEDVNEEEEEEESQDEDLAPDGGWGWMVTLGLILVFVRMIN